ncbi:MAG: ATP-binding cassette domain-containing protein [Devosiaceae bacterium]|nr:ATP-binding cassette domain-containing protein [Devosiaceae bacterium]
MNDQAITGLQLDNVEIFKGTVRLLGMDAIIAPGQILTLMGPSGSGKSTLINAIAGFLPSSFSCTGTIRLNGQNITTLPPESRRVGVLFQDPLLFPHFSVLQNILFALPAGGTMHERCDKALTLLHEISMDEFADADPDTLSGGQKARVALARVIASTPNALLLDEPFSKLDADLRDSMRQLVCEEVARRKIPTLLVTHDKDDASATDGPVLTL